MEAENLNETLNKDFSALTEENKKSVIDMAKFLVLTQNAIIPAILTEKNMLADAPPVEKEGEKQEIV
jgi:hypothetical protein